MDSRKGLYMFLAILLAVVASYFAGSHAGSSKYGDYDKYKAEAKLHEENARKLATQAAMLQSQVDSLSSSLQALMHTRDSLAILYWDAKNNKGKSGGNNGKSNSTPGSTGLVSAVQRFSVNADRADRAIGAAASSR